MMKFIILLIGVLIISGILFTLFYYGFFVQPQVAIQKSGGETIVFRKANGDYKKSGIVMDEVYYKLANDFGIDTFKGIGIFYNNPQETQIDALRYEAGCVLESSHVQELSSSKNVPFEIKTLPIEESVVISFPYRNRLSVLFGTIKVYPLLTKYIRSNHYDESTPVIEIYDVPNKQIVYRKKIIKL